MKGTVLLFALCYFYWKCSTGEAGVTCPIIKICPNATEALLDKGQCSGRKKILLGANRWCEICGIFDCQNDEEKLQREQIKANNQKQKKNKCERKCKVQTGKCPVEDKYDRQRGCWLCPQYVECGHTQHHGGIVV